MKLDKKRLEVLCKIFDREIKGQLPWQSGGRKDSKLLLDMLAEGLIRRMKVKLPGRFSITIEGWELTELGRYEWCNA